MPGKGDDARLDAFLAAFGEREIVDLAARLITFPTVSAENGGSAGNPAFAEMAGFLREWAEARGLSFRVWGRNDVFEVNWGGGEPVLGFVLHGDVVPAPAQEWKRKPFEPLIEGGRLYGRGAEDDKGPLASVLVMMAFAKELGIIPRGAVKVIIGNGEENDWEPMLRFIASERQPATVISIDGTFPVMVAQSGFVEWTLEAAVSEPVADQALAEAVLVQAGEFLTQVPGSARLVLEPLGAAKEKVEAAVKEIVAALARERKGFSAEVNHEGERLVVTTKGRPVHSSIAEQGHNAIWDLSAVAARLPLAKNGIAELLGVLASKFDGDHWGERLGIAYRDDLMGPLLVAPTQLYLKDGKVRLSVNLRRPRGKDRAAFQRSLVGASLAISRETGGTVKTAAGTYIGDPYVADTSGTLVKTLLDIWKRRRNDHEARPTAMRGSTYARLFPGAVDFGPQLPGEPLVAHQPDEFVRIGTLVETARMLGEALVKLAVERPPASGRRSKE